MSAADPRQKRGFRLLVWLARVVVTGERVWPALWPALGTLGVFALLSLFGLWLVVPRPVHILLLATFAGILAWTCLLYTSDAADEL